MKNNFITFQDWYSQRFINASTDKARFIKHIEANTINNFYKAANKTKYITADQMIVALALNHGLFIDFEKAFASVDCSLTSTRGKVTVDWSESSGNIKIAKAVDLVAYGRMMIHSLHGCE